MVEIECLVCGETVKIPQFVDPDDYDGQVVCQNCASLLHIKLVQQKLKKYEVKEKYLRKYEKVEKMLEELTRLGKESTSK